MTLPGKIIDSKFCEIAGSGGYGIWYGNPGVYVMVRRFFSTFCGSTKGGMELFSSWLFRFWGRYFSLLERWPVDQNILRSYMMDILASPLFQKVIFSKSAHNFFFWMLLQLEGTLEKERVSAHFRIFAREEARSLLVSCRVFWFPPELCREKYLSAVPGSRTHQLLDAPLKKLIHPWWIIGLSRGKNATVRDTSRGMLARHFVEWWNVHQDDNEPFLTEADTKEFLGIRACLSKPHSAWSKTTWQRQYLTASLWHRRHSDIKKTLTLMIDCLLTSSPICNMLVLYIHVFHSFPEGSKSLLQVGQHSRQSLRWQLTDDFSETSSWAWAFKQNAADKIH